MGWNAKSTGGYGMTTTEAEENVSEIWSILSNRGWSAEAVSGMLGNFQAESGLNPWRYQSDKVKTVEESRTSSLGYGLGQWSPMKNYLWGSARDISGYAPNFRDRSGEASDGYAQIIFTDEQSGQWIATSSAYNLSFAEYKASTRTPSELAQAWYYGWERPPSTDTTLPTRQSNAEHWYTYITGELPPSPPEPPTPPTPPKPTLKKRFKWWIYMRRIRRLL